MWPGNIFAATLFFMPSSDSVSAGSTISVNVMVASPDQSMNAVSSQIAYPRDKLELLTISKSGSIITIWATEPAFSNADGSANFEGIVPNPGYIGNSGKIVTFTFRAKSVGSATLSFNSGSVLANDGLATNILTSSPSKTVTIFEGSPTPAPASSQGEPAARSLKITSPTHPNQSAWYKTTEARFVWQSAPDAVAIRLGYGENPQGIPQVNYQPPVEQKTLTLEDGVTYFSAQERTQSGWQNIARYKVQIDTVPPQPFTVTVAQEEAQPVRLRFKAEDDRSGIDRYDIFLNTKKVATVSEGELHERGFELPPTEAGEVNIQVIAHDRAGNTVSAHATYVSEGAPVAEESGLRTMTFSRIFDIMWTIANYLTLLLIFVSALAVVVSIVRFGWRRFHHAHHSFIKHFISSDTDVRTELHELRTALKAEVVRLRALADERPLSAEETHILKLLDNTERIMKHELPKI